MNLAKEEGNLRLFRSRYRINSTEQAKKTATSTFSMILLWSVKNGRTFRKTPEDVEHSRKARK